MNHRAFFFWWPATLLALILAHGAAPAAAQGFKWWQSERFQRELQLTADQIARIENVFQSGRPELRRQKETLDRLERDLERLIDTADEAAVMKQADRVEAIRSDLSKARTRMLVRMRRVLTAEQRVKLAALHDAWDRDRKRQDRRR